MSPGAPHTRNYDVVEDALAALLELCNKKALQPAVHKAGTLPLLAGLAAAPALTARAASKLLMCLGHIVTAPSLAGMFGPAGDPAITQLPLPALLSQLGGAHEDCFTSGYLIEGAAKLTENGFVAQLLARAGAVHAFSSLLATPAGSDESNATHIRDALGRLQSAPALPPLGAAAPSALPPPGGATAAWSLNPAFGATVAPPPPSPVATGVVLRSPLAAQLPPPPPVATAPLAAAGTTPPAPSPAAAATASEGKPKTTVKKKKAAEGGATSAAAVEVSSAAAGETAGAAAAGGKPKKKKAAAVSEVSAGEPTDGAAAKPKKKKKAA
jgi:hypothetical protein